MAIPGAGPVPAARSSDSPRRPAARARPRTRAAGPRPPRPGARTPPLRRGPRPPRARTVRARPCRPRTPSPPARSPSARAGRARGRGGSRRDPGWTPGRCARAPVPRCRPCRCCPRRRPCRRRGPGAACGLRVLGAEVPVQAGPGAVDSVRAVPVGSVPSVRSVPVRSVPVRSVPGAGPASGPVRAARRRSRWLRGPPWLAVRLAGRPGLAPSRSGGLGSVRGWPGLGARGAVPGVPGPVRRCLLRPRLTVLSRGWPGRPGRAWRTRRGNSGLRGPPRGTRRRPGPRLRPSSRCSRTDWRIPDLGARPWSRRCRPAGGTTTELPTAGGPGLVLPRDRDPPGPGRMYRRTRSKSRSRISRTPSDRVPGCQRMTKLRERHLSLPAVTGYGSRTVTE